MSEIVEKERKMSSVPVGGVSLKNWPRSHDQDYTRNTRFLRTKPWDFLISSGGQSRVDMSSIWRQRAIGKLVSRSQVHTPQESKS